MALLGRGRKSVPDDVPKGNPAPPEAVLRSAGLGSGEKVHAAAQDDWDGAWVLATTWRLVTVGDDGQVQLDRPWLTVDSGSWDPDTYQLGVSWVDGTPVTRWRLRSSSGPGRLPEALHDRVSASVVLTRHVDLGTGRTARVVIRKDLATRELHEQVLVDRAARPGDTELRDEVARARTEVRSQVGLPPSGRPGDW